MNISIDKYLKETNTVLVTQDTFMRMKNIIDKYRKIEQIYQKWNEVNDLSYNQVMQKIGEVIKCD